MKSLTVYNSGLVIVMGTLAFLLTTAIAAPMETDEDASEVGLGGREGEELAPWDTASATALRKLLLQLDADDRVGARVGRSWSAAEPRGWSLRALDGRLARQWRADKRQVRFRQCYFNPISCFRK